MHYQDKWVRGRACSRGERDCEARYEPIRDFLAQYTRPFTVADLGANVGYFSLRIAEDFPQATVVAFEPIETAPLAATVDENGAQRIIILNRRLDEPSIKTLVSCESFDVVLAMSVVHYLGPSYERSLSLLKRMGDHLLIELPHETTAANSEIVRQIPAGVPEGATLLSMTPGHLGQGDRRLLWFRGGKIGLERSYCLSQSRRPNLTIASTFGQKTVGFHNKAEASRDWLPGINLCTWREFGGVRPTTGRVREMLEGLGRPLTRHGDIRLWNLVLSGDRLHWIDFDHAGVGVYDDAASFDALLKGLS